MKHPQLIEFLKQRVSLCNHFADDRLDQLVKESRVVSYEPNEAVVEFGEDAGFLGVLLEGDLAASVLGDGGQRQVIGRFQAGDTFGEMALMSGDKTMADVIAETRCQVLRIPVAVFQSVIMADPRAVQHISRTMADRFKQLLADPAQAAAAFRQSDDPYGLHLKGERPEKILVINSGSSSLKYTFFDTANELNAARGLVERIGASGTRLVHRGPRGEMQRELPQGGYGDAFRAMLSELSAPGTGVIREASDVSVVGRRVVHGGERFSEAVVVDEQVLKDIEALNPLAPLHNPVNVAGIREALRLFPAVPHVAVFDTAFHHTLPSYAYLYGLPYEYYEKQGVRRYGFHGSSHAAHHIHLSQEHVEALFGKGHQITAQSDLSQPGQFACQEQLAIVGPKGRIERARVLGPARKATQVEIAMTEQFKLGIHPPIRESGDLRDTPGGTLEGPAGSVTLDRGVICALRHVHMTPADAVASGPVAVRDIATRSEAVIDGTAACCGARDRRRKQEERETGDILLLPEPSGELEK